MKFPKPWAEADPQSIEGDLVRAAREERLEDAERQALWAAIAAGLPTEPSRGEGQGAELEPEPPGAARPADAAGPGAANVVAPAASGVRAVLGMAWVKGLVVLAGGVALGVVGLARNRVETTSTPTASVASVASAASVASVASAISATWPAGSAASATAAPGTAAPGTAPDPDLDGASRRTPVTGTMPGASETSALREESQLLLEARAALRAGSPTSALDFLHRSRMRFPRGILLQEREALTIEALAASGQNQLAAQRAQQFLSQFPRSPHAAEVRKYLAR